jgi:hypothetical protein
MKVFEKLKKIGKRCKVVVATAAAAVVGVVSSVCASAATTEAGGFDMSKAMSDAGRSIQNQFGVLVTTLIPVMVGILVTGLAIYGIFTLVKVAKKIFGKVAG